MDPELAVRGVQYNEDICNKCAEIAVSTQLLELPRPVKLKR